MLTGLTVITSDTVGDDDADPAVKPNAKQTNVGGDFPHMFDISRKARVCWSSPTRSRTRQGYGGNGGDLTNVPVTAEQITSLGESSDGGTSFPGTFDHDDDADDTPAIEGTFKCTDGPCSLVIRAAGTMSMVTTATGYTFSGSREGVTAVEADAKEDYLLFGVWLDEVAEGDDAGADTFGAIATGGQPFTADQRASSRR